MQDMDGLKLLEEILTVCPMPVIDLMTHLIESLRPDQTQTRFMEIGPLKWWLKNVTNCPIIAKLFLGSEKSTHYCLSAVSIRVTNFPIFSKTSERRGLRFLELKYHMSVVTQYSLTSPVSYVQCKHYSRDAWSERDDGSRMGGLLVSGVLC